MSTPRYHPVYARRRRAALFMGWGLILLGVIGAILPFMQGLVLVFIGISILSIYVAFARSMRTGLLLRFPSISRQFGHLEGKILNYVKLTSHSREYVQTVGRDGLTRSVLLEVSEMDAGTALVLHSAGGTKDTQVSEILAERCRERGFTVVRFDAANGLGESAGQFAAFTTTTYLRDLEEMVVWAKAQPWFSAPLVLVGHSVGGLVALLYAEEHPADVHELLVLAPTISGSRYVATYETTDREGFARWRGTGSRIIPHPHTDEDVAFSFGFVDDLMRHDALPMASALTMPVTALIGDTDRTVTVDEVRELTTAMGTRAQVVVMPGVRHTPLEVREFKTLRTALSHWPSLIFAVSTTIN